MNKLLTTISCTLLVCACEAQTMRVWMKDGSERQFAVSEIESVTFSEEDTSMEQLKKEIEQFLDDWNDAMIAADTVHGHDSDQARVAGRGGQRFNEVSQNREARCRGDLKQRRFSQRFVHLGHHRHHLGQLRNMDAQRNNETSETQWTLDKN